MFLYGRQRSDSMIIRKIREEEYRRTQEVFGIAFEIQIAKEQLSDEKWKQIRENPKSRQERYYKERWAAFDDDGQMMGFLIGFPATIRFDGNEVVCTCIGGVSSLPQYRGKGVIAGCFRKHLEDSYQKGYAFSYLYPFSTVFYRQFGYELCSETVDWEFDIRTVPYFPEAKGAACLNERSSEKEAVMQVYADYMKEYNLSFVREEYDWIKVIHDDPAVENAFTYVWKNQEGRPKGVLCYHKEYSDKHPGGLMQMEAFYFSDEEGLKGLFNHIRAYRSHFQSVRLSVPKQVALQRILPEVSGNAFGRKIVFHGMGRVIHAENALRMARYRGSGTVSVKLNDEYIRENNRVFKVTFEDGRCIALEEGTDWDVELDIGTFSRCLLGCCDENEYEKEEVRKIFYGKKTFICDGF